MIGTILIITVAVLFLGGFTVLALAYAAKRGDEMMRDVLRSHCRGRRVVSAKEFTKDKA